MTADKPEAIAAAINAKQWVLLAPDGTVIASDDPQVLIERLIAARDEGDKC